MSLTPERTAELQELCRQYRIDVLTAIHGAQSGHPGGSLSVCEILTLLYQQRMHVDAAHPDDPDRDRLVLCKGHAAPMLYRNLIGKGFLPPESMNTLRQTGSPLQGHPCMRTPGVDMPSGPLGIGLAAGIMGVAVGIPALRLRGDYLAIVTMAFAEIIRVCFCNFSITGGGKTMSGILKLSTFPRVFWIMVVCVTIMYLFVRSKYGRTVQAIREDYIAASASGINVTYYKVMTFAISAFFAGIGGGIYAHYMTAMIPTNFNFNYSAELLSEVIIGGTGSLTGSIIGAAFLSALPELMREFSTYRMLAYSVVLVLVMLFRPGGIFGRWEFSLNRLLDGIRHPKEKAAKGA